MRLLTWLTVVYAGVLVAALVLVLTAICVLLWRISFVLSDVGKALTSAADATAPLERQLTSVADGVRATGDAFASARADLSRAVEHVESRTGGPVASGS